MGYVNLSCYIEKTPKVFRINPIWSGGGGGISPHLYFSTVAARRTEKSGGHGVCKSKLLHWEDTQNGFWSKKILWPGPEALEVGPAAKFWGLEI